MIENKEQPPAFSTEYHGISIKEIWMPTEVDYFDYSYSVGKGGVTSMYLSATHHGDRDEFWIVVMTNKEKSLINPRYVTEIVWENDTREK